MSDSCDFTKPVAHESEMDRGLSVYRDSHRAVARYTLVLCENFRQKANYMVVDQNMDYVSVDEKCRRLNAARPETGFHVPVFAILLENPAEAHHAVSVAAEAYWATQRTKVAG